MRSSLRSAKVASSGSESAASMPETMPFLGDGGNGEDATCITMACLSDDVCERILSFIVMDLASWKLCTAVSRQLCSISYSPISWMDACIQLPATAMARDADVKQVLKLASSWQLAKSLSLTAHPRRQALAVEMKKLCPGLDIITAQQGPYLMFVMGSRCEVGNEIGLHFFEPRYRWMCRRLLETERPQVFAFVTRGDGSPGSKGVLCEISRSRRNGDGTFDVIFVARSAFSVLEMWHEHVPDQPRAPALAVGHLDVSEPIQGRAMSMGSAPSAVGMACSVRDKLACFLGCFVFSSRCCPRRR